MKMACVCIIVFLLIDIMLDSKETLVAIKSQVDSVQLGALLLFISVSKNNESLLVIVLITYMYTCSDSMSMLTAEVTNPNFVLLLCVIAELFVIYLLLNRHHYFVCLDIYIILLNLLSHIYISCINWVLRWLSIYYFIDEIKGFIYDYILMLKCTCLGDDYFTEPRLLNYGYRHIQICNTGHINITVCILFLVTEMYNHKLLYLFSNILWLMSVSFSTVILATYFILSTLYDGG